MGVVRTERIKLAASALNNLAVAVLVSAVAVPAIGSVGGIAGAHLLAFTPGWLVGSVFLHIVAQTLLGALKDDAS